AREDARPTRKGKLSHYTFSAAKEQQPGSRKAQHAGTASAAPVPKHSAKRFSYRCALLLLAGQRPCTAWKRFLERGHILFIKMALHDIEQAFLDIRLRGV